MLYYCHDEIAGEHTTRRIVEDRDNVGRPTLEPGEPTEKLEIKLPRSMKREVAEKCEAYSISMSEYVRRLISKDLQQNKQPNGCGNTH